MISHYLLWSIMSWERQSNEQYNNSLHNGQGSISVSYNLHEDKHFKHYWYSPKYLSTFYSVITSIFSPILLLFSLFIIYYGVWNYFWSTSISLFDFLLMVFLVSFSFWDVKVIVEAKNRGCCLELSYGSKDLSLPITLGNTKWRWTTDCTKDRFLKANLFYETYLNALSYIYTIWTRLAKVSTAGVSLLIMEGFGETYWDVF